MKQKINGKQKEREKKEERKRERKRGKKERERGWGNCNWDVGVQGDRSCPNMDREGREIMMKGKS